MDKEDIKLVRGVLGLTQQEFSQLTGYSCAHLKGLEAGNRPVNLQFHNKLAEVIHTEAYRNLVRSRLDRLSRIEEELNEITKRN